jgi:hypothetical protein
MALPQNVKDALSRVHLMADTESEWADIDIADWKTIHAHLLSQDAEIELLRVGCEQNLLHAQMAESRLAALENTHDRA